MAAMCATVVRMSGVRMSVVRMGFVRVMIVFHVCMLMQITPGSQGACSGAAAGLRVVAYNGAFLRVQPC